eukprot:364398_1
MTSLRYQLLREGINSGDSGLARDSFHVLRQILRRIDDAASGQMCDLSVEMPSTHKQSVRALGEYQIPFDTAQWQPQIAVVEEECEQNFESHVETTAIDHWNGWHANGGGCRQCVASIYKS